LHLRPIATLFVMAITQIRFLPARRPPART